MTFFVTVVFFLACVSVIVAVYAPGLSALPDSSVSRTFLPGRMRVPLTEPFLVPSAPLIDRAADGIERVAGVSDRQRERPGRPEPTP